MKSTCIVASKGIRIEKGRSIIHIYVNLYICVCVCVCVYVYRNIISGEPELTIHKVETRGSFLCNVHCPRK